ncbi:MAG TPA: Zn-dependent hydrolase [Candidatus Micrarchaeaceae archaeon]|nr:Zn-dependent hydrolase [Candidatus Micrarchaeaceae archaeon]
MISLQNPDQNRLWRQLMELAEMVEPDQPGFTRRLFSEPYRQSRGWVKEQMEAAGLEVHVDPVGNLLGATDGARPDLPRLVLGSHTDTVAGAGRFDGMVGVIGAIEVARLIRQGGEQLRHPLLVVDFLGEEPNRFGLSCLGSRAVVGQLTQSHLALRDDNDGTLAAALAAQGSQIDSLSQAVWPAERLHAYLELHIEQGTALEAARAPLGVVTAIAGIHRALITAHGRTDHAGTVSMADRRDALAAGAEVILLVERLANHSTTVGTGVGTVGRLEVSPGATNVVPGQTTAWAEFRSTEAGWLRDRGSELELGVGEIARRRGIELRVDWVSAESPVTCAPGVRQEVLQALRELGHPVIELPSGASHDAAQVARLCPMGMIFVPSLRGRSHCPEEWTDPAAVALGVRSLLAGVLRLDQLDSF